MTSRTGLLPVPSKVEHRFTKVNSSSTKSKPVRRSLATFSSVKKPHATNKVVHKPDSLPACQNTEAGPHARCGACSAKKCLGNTSHVNVNRPALKRKSHPGFLSEDKPLQKVFTPNRRSWTSEKLAKDENQIPKSILKRAPGANSTMKEYSALDNRHVQFSGKATDQASLRAKLNAWLKDKGKTPGHYRHLMNFGASLSAKKKKDVLSDSQKNGNQQSDGFRKKLFKDAPVTACGKENTSQTCSYDGVVQDIVEENEQHLEAENLNNSSQVHDDEIGDDVLNNLKTMLDECLNLFYSGCSLEDILPWLEEMETNIPKIVTFAPFYICKAKVMGAFPQMVLEVYTDAVRHNAQPCDLLATEMKNSFSQILGPQNKRSRNPKPVSSCSPPVQPSQESLPPCQTPRAAETPLVEGSVKKYKVTTPSLRRVSEAAVAVVTPVRRSSRLSKSNTPCHKLFGEVVDNVTEISPTERRSMVFKVNPALVNDENLSSKLDYESVIQSNQNGLFNGTGVQ
ncbi:cytoskeleton-associated protein 2-like [Physella acuta]|uniref:cytoskeleton-associated protein 2-like n=1 Tax=Physella acuta TaxID=109671 RepID=UPI0027DD90C3|nr:cytoskeleton-associated protein 2-like [Physella acuta]